MRHEAAPLLKERELYLTHLLHRGFGRAVVRCTAAYLVHIVRVMNMTSLRSVGQEEIDTAGEVWAAYEGPHRKKLKVKGFVDCVRSHCPAVVALSLPIRTHHPLTLSSSS